MQQDPIKIVLVDDHPPLLTAWKRLIEGQADLKLVAALDRTDDLVRYIREGEADLLMIDLSMPGKQPLDVIAEISRECPKTQVVVYSAQSAHTWSSKVKEAGAAEYIDKCTAPSQVLSILRRTARQDDGAR